MLDKDQYNQDEYNDYYAQETRGAEISRGRGEEGRGKKMTVIFLLLTLILAVGYFGWKSMNSSTLEEATIDKNEIISNSEEPKKLEYEEKDKEVTSTSTLSEQEDDIVKQIQSISSQKKMTPQDVANIIKIVMKKINKNNNIELNTTTSTPKLTSNPEEEAQDSQLMESLTSTDVDSLSSISESDEKKKPTLSKDIDIYNKVVLQKDKANINDALSQLSDELSTVVESEDDLKPTNSNVYTESIAKEVETRQKEMRYYIVKKGDTLGKIAKRFYGNVMDYKKIFEANPDVVRREDKVYIGQRLRIP